jgi:hypothetical protein
MTSDWLFTYAPLIALAVSMFALIASSLSLGWNVYRDVVLKPRLKVKFGIKYIVRPGDDETPTQTSPPLLELSGTNHGPGEVVCQGAVVRIHSLIRSFFREFPYGFVQPDFANPFCSKLPSRLAIGDQVKVIFPYSRECFLEATPILIGITDSFGRVHWASRRELKRACRQHHKDFGSQRAKGSEDT